MPRRSGTIALLSTMSPVARVGLRRAIVRVFSRRFRTRRCQVFCASSRSPDASCVREDPLRSADAIFVLAGSRVERWLEGYELYRERQAPLIVLSPGPTSKAEIDLRAKGVRFPSEGEVARDALLQLGVPAEAILILPRAVDNTAQEAQALHDISRTRDMAAHHRGDVRLPYAARGASRSDASSRALQFRLWFDARGSTNPSPHDGGVIARTSASSRPNSRSWHCMDWDWEDETKLAEAPESRTQPARVTQAATGFEDREGQRAPFASSLDPGAACSTRRAEFDSARRLPLP